nr:MAG TPA: hypothetical protein [Caudoviricetes sp.]
MLEYTILYFSYSICGVSITILTLYFNIKLSFCHWI